MRLERLGAAGLRDPLGVLAPGSLEPGGLRIALEREDVRRDAVEEPAIVGDHHCATREVEQRVFERAQRVDVEIVGRLVEQQHVAPAGEHLREVHAIALSAGQIADALLLVAALEVEPGHVLPRVHLALAEDDVVVAAADLLPDGVRRSEIGARLVDVGELHGVADAQHPTVRALLAGDHPEERRLAGAVRADHADDAGGRQRERQVLDEQPVAEALLDALGLDDDVAEPRAGRDVDLDLVELHVLLVGEQLLVRTETRLRLRVPRAGLIRTHSSSRASVRRRADSVFSSTASRSCFCSSHDE